MPDEADLIICDRAHASTGAAAAQLQHGMMPDL